MLIGNAKQEHVKFVQYDGRYPNLCSGMLTLEIDGDQYKFHPYKYDNKTIFPSFWRSGGGLLPDYAGAYQGEWEIDISAIPEQFRKYAYEIDSVFNRNVVCGCCGGCI